MTDGVTAMTAPTLKVSDIAFARVRAPDLAVAEEFLTDFGLIKVAEEKGKLFFRGTDSPHHIYVAEQGDASFIGFAFHAQSEEDLERATHIPGASAIENIDEPGGGRRVRLTEPNGYQIEIVHGLEQLPAISLTRFAINTGAQPHNRRGILTRLPEGPTPVKRIAHGVIGSPKVQETATWFRDHLGLLCSDDVYAGEEANVIGSFNRVNRGDDYVDHHTFAVFNFGGATGLHHISFEVEDIDAVFGHHYYLRGKGKYDQRWGVGRHMLGSQVFDYWGDPWGRIHERWADSDRLNADTAGGLQPPEIGLVSQWGDEFPESMSRVTA